MNEIFDYSHLEEWYIKDGLSYLEIAQRIGCKWRAVFHAMKRQGIPARGQRVTMQMKEYNKYLPYKHQIEEGIANIIPLTVIAKSFGWPPQRIYKAMKSLNIPKPDITKYTGKLTANWKGGKKYESFHGYIRVRMLEHPYAATDGYVPEHRLVMEKHLGRYLLPTEQVHHIDGDKTNNELSNLQLLSPSDHRMKTLLCSHCQLRKEIRRLKNQLSKAQATCQLLLEKPGVVNRLPKLEDIND
jgi:predicted DNA-binding protein YlxM (UPF0122 family)